VEDDLVAVRILKNEATVQDVAAASAQRSLALSIKRLYPGAETFFPPKSAKATTATTIL
jgi:hypothetical protein